MDPSQWIAAFRLTHEQARRGGLNDGELKKYMGMRDELARSLMNSQGLIVPEAPRYIDRSEFFNSFYDLLKREPGITAVRVSV